MHYYIRKRDSGRENFRRSGRISCLFFCGLLFVGLQRIILYDTIIEDIFSIAL